MMQQRLRGKELARRIVVTTDRARQGVTGHGVRYVLTNSLLGVIFMFAMLLVIFAN